MAILPILKDPDPKLRVKSSEIKNIDEDIKILAANMAKTMLNALGAGLAAPQVGKAIRLIVIAGAENGEDFDERIITLINPKIIRTEGQQTFEEGCLSVREYTEKVIRANEIEVEAQDIDGKFFTIKADGRKAVILQHEIDHLDGILFIDHLSRLKRDIYKRKLCKLDKEANDE